MTIDATFTVDRDEFPLSTVFEQLPDATIELDRIVPTSGAVVPYFWIYADDTGDLKKNLKEEVGIDSVQIIDELEEQMFIRVAWNLDHESVLTALINTDVTLLSGRGDSEGWTFEVRASEQQPISAFQTYCTENGIQTELVELHAIASLKSDREYDLTEGQREALILAYSRGYFDSPRRATQEDLATELEISRQAVSSRLQRGFRRLVASTLITPQE